MGDFTYAEKSDMHLMYGRANGNTELHYECIRSAFLIDECRTTGFLNGYIANFVKEILSTSPDTRRVDRELYAVNAWNKAPGTLWLTDTTQVQELLYIA